MFTTPKARDFNWHVLNLFSHRSAALTNHVMHRIMLLELSLSLPFQKVMGGGGESNQDLTFQKHNACKNNPPKKPQFERTTCGTLH